MANNNNASAPPKEEFVAVGPGADDEANQRSGPHEDSAAGDDYQYPDGDAGGEGEGTGAERGEEARAGHAEGEDDQEGSERLSPEQKRRRRRKERFARDQRELSFLRNRNAELESQFSRRMADVESRQTSTELNALDARINQAQTDLREAESLFSQAVKSGDADSVAEALRIRDDLRDGLRGLQNVKANAGRRAAAPPEQNQPQQQQRDPDIVRRAEQWLQDNPWYDPNLRDVDSQIAKAVENDLWREGRLDPRTPAYWAEYNRRLARRIPDLPTGRPRDDDDDDEEEEGDARGRHKNGNGGGRRPSGPEIRVGGRERPLRRGEVYIDPERRRALEEAGAWEDEETRNRYLKQYAKFDREHGRRRNH